jgi:hypothetical protein
VFVEGDRDFESAMSVSDILLLALPRKLEWRRINQPRPCLPVVIWNGFVVKEANHAEWLLLDLSLRNLEGMEMYRDYFSVPAAIRFSTQLSVRRVRECGVVVLWPIRTDYPAK